MARLTDTKIRGVKAELRGQGVGSPSSGQTFGFQNRGHKGVPPPSARVRKQSFSPWSGRVIRGAPSIAIQANNASAVAGPDRIEDLERQILDLQTDKRALESRVRRLQAKNVELEAVYRDYEAALGTANAMTVKAEVLELEIRQIFDTSPDAMWIVDKRHRVKRVNDAMLKLLDTTAEETVGRRCHEVMPVSLCSGPGCPLVKFREGAARVEADTELCQPAGRPVPFILTASPFFGLDGELVGVVGSFKDITERKEAEAALQDANRELARVAAIDGLTQIANRRHFDACLEQEWRRLQRERKPLALILSDIDFFKNYNDYYGHQLGDDCLWSVAQAIEANVRRPADLAARYGGEEFAVILPNTPLEGGLHVAECIRRAVCGLQIDHSRSAVAAHVTMSIGISAAVPGQGGSMERLLQTADAALYQAKSEGRNCVRSRPMPSILSP